MYKIRATIGNASIESILSEDNLTAEQIQQKGQDIFRPSINMLKAKKQLKDKGEIAGKDIGELYEKLVIEYSEIEPPKTETPVAIVELDDLDRKQLLVQQALAEQRIVDIQAALAAYEKTEKEEIVESLKAEAEK